ncbi:MAG: TonB-dependent receptor [Opitutaceae bacterium]|nr:TonB-dependent receptor [Opitutaceae bacterium]
MMKRNQTCALLCAALAAQPALIAQTTAPAPEAQSPAPTTASAPESEEPSDEEMVTLSPFEVRAGAEEGYRATDTLGGTRIRTELKDVGSAISVATAEFMRDIGATDAQTLLPYMTSMEVGGTGGNFLVGSTVGDSTMINDNAARQNPQGNTRVRGLNAADNTRDFFMTDVGFDTYNTSRIDVQRGANSILFGNGSGAGIINAGVDGAQIGPNSTVVTARFGQYGSYRGSLNFNQTLVKDQLAIRFAALEDKKIYRQEPAYNRDERIYGALRYEPSFLKKGSAKTTFRASFESGKIDANRPRANTIADNMFAWFIKDPIELRSPYPLGRPEGVDDTLMGYLTPLKTHSGYDPFVVGISQASTLGGGRLDVGARATYSATTNPNAEAWLGAVVKTTDQGASQSGGGFDPQNGGYSSWWAIFDQPDARQVSSIMYPGIPTPYNAVNNLGVRDGNAISGIRAPDMQGLTTLTNYSQRGQGSLLYTLQGKWRQITISDPSIFDFYNKLIDGPNKGEGSEFDTYNAAIDQTFWDGKAGFQLALDHQEYASWRWGNLNNPSISIDVFTKLPVALLNPETGLYEPVDNPNFGRPYVISPSTGNNRSYTTRDTQRVTPFVDLDFRQLLKSDNWATKILGRHTITGLFERNEVEREGLTYYRYAVEAQQAAALFGPNRPVGDASRNIAMKTYIGPSIINAPSESDLHLSAITAVQRPGNIMTGTSNNTYVSNAYWFDSTWTGAALPAGAGVAWDRPALGLAPNALGPTTGTAATQAENPNNYRGWNGTPRQLAIDVQNDTGDYRPFATAASMTKTKITSQAIVDQWKLLDNNVVITAGMRKDTIKNYTPGNPLLPADSTLRTGSRYQNPNSGLVDWDAPFEYPDSPSSTYTSPWLETYGGVVHTPESIKKRLPFGLEFSPFWSRSANFQPAIRKDVITGEPLVPPTGNTTDYGIMIGALDGRISFRVTKYETKIKNATLPDNSILNFIRDEVVRGIQFSLNTLYVRQWNEAGNGSSASAPFAGNGGYFFRADNGVGQALPDNQTHWYPWQPARPATTEAPWTQAEWDAEEAHAYRSAEAFMASLQDPLAQQFLAANNIDISKFDYSAANSGITSTAPAGVAITGDTISRGTEYELFLQPTPNWSIAINAAKSFATQVNLAGNANKWLEDRWALYNELDPLYEGGFLAGDVRWFGGGQGNVSSGNARFGRNGYRFYSEFHSLEGTNVPELRPWRFNLTTNYRFTTEKLNGFFVGGSFRWEDRSVLGFGMTETDPEVLKQVGSTVTSLRAAFARLDPTKPYYGEREQHVDLLFGFSTKKLFKDIDWRIQVNIRNVGESVHLVPITVQPTGQAAAYRIADGMGWEITNTFKF